VSSFHVIKLIPFLVCFSMFLLHFVLVKTFGDVNLLICTPFPINICLSQCDKMLICRVAMQSEPTTSNVVSSNPVHGEVNSIQHYVINFVSDLRQVGGFFPGTPVSSANRTDRHDITEILLKVALNNITLTL